MTLSKSFPKLRQLQCSGNRFSICFTIKLWQMTQYINTKWCEIVDKFLCKEKHQHAKTWTHENSSPEKSHETTTLLKWQLCLCLASCTRHSQRNINKFIFICSKTQRSPNERILLMTSRLSILKLTCSLRQPLSFSYNE